MGQKPNRTADQKEPTQYMLIWLNILPSHSMPWTSKLNAYSQKVRCSVKSIFIEWVPYYQQSSLVAGPYLLSILSTYYYQFYKRQSPHFFWDQTYTVAFIHPPTTTQSFLPSSRHSRMLKLGIKLNKKPNPNLKKKNL